MKAIAVVVLLLAFSGSAAQAASWEKKLLKASWVALVASRTADIHSSLYYGSYEVNPLFRGADGNFGPRAAVTLAGITAGFVAVQWVVTEKIHSPKGKKIFRLVFAAENIRTAVLTFKTAANNYQLEKR